MAKYNQKFIDLNVDNVAKEAASRKEQGWHFIQMLAMTQDKACDLIYTYKKDDKIEDLIVKGVTSTDNVPSITGSYLAAFVFENEAHDLFGLNIKDIAIDFGGKFYNVAVDKPMTIISPEVAARKEKQAKIEAAMAAKKAKTAVSSATKPAAKTITKKEGKGE